MSSGRGLQVRRISAVHNNLNVLLGDAGTPSSAVSAVQIGVLNPT